MGWPMVQEAETLKPVISRLVITLVWSMYPGVVSGGWGTVWGCLVWLESCITFFELKITFDNLCRLGTILIQIYWLKILRFLSWISR